MAGVVLVTEFTVPEQSSSSSSNFSGFVEYIDRESAKSVSDYLNYMDNENKTDTLFTDTSDEITSEQKECLKTAFDMAQENGSLMWQTVLTFDNDFLEEHGLYDTESKVLDSKKIMEYTRGCMSNLLKSENLLDSSVWTGAIHYNTDNIHVHIATVEPIPQREKKSRKYIELSKDFLNENNIQIPTKSTRDNIYSEKTEKEIKNLYFECKKALPQDIQLSNTIFVTDKGTVKIAVKELGGDKLAKGITLQERLEPKGRFKQSSINKGKGYVINQIIGSKEINNQINNVIRKNILEIKRGSSLIKDKDLADKFLKIHSMLPQDKRLWRYNMHEIEPIQPFIDDLSKAYIAKYHKEDFKQLEALLERQEKAYTKAYGENSVNNLKDNKVQDLYTRLGNTILAELREYDKEIGNKRYERQKDSRLEDYQKQHDKFELNRISHTIDNSLRKLKKYLNKDYEHFKNQQAYEQLQCESEISI